MRAIYKKELRSYFSSPIGYVCIAAIAALYGFFYYAYVMRYGKTEYIADVYSTIFQFAIMIIPIITMRTFSEEQKNKTDQALLTAPVSVTSIVMGKFLSSFTVFFIGSVLGLLPAVALTFVASPPWGIIIGNFIGTLLYGGAMISIGLLISSLTQSQVISALGTFAAALALMLVDNLSSGIDNAVVSTIVSWISFNQRYSSFTAGIFSISSLVFFVSMTALFVFITSRRVESRRWN